jgi:toxin YoeB
MDVRFTASAHEDWTFWQKKDPRKASRIRALLLDIREHPYAGIGKPEPLKFDLQGCWSRRIDRTHRLVYRLERKTIVVISCRYHY